jgi:hypothetical protein
MPEPKMPLARFKVVDLTRVSFSGDYVRRLGPDGALVVASLWHDNSSQSYDIKSLVLARPEGPSSIGDVLALGSRICNDKSGELVAEESTVRVTPDGMPLARIDVEVRRGIQKFTGDCETKLGREAKTTFNGYWRWDAKKAAYEPHTKELNIFADWNQKHF